MPRYKPVNRQRNVVVPIRFDTQINDEPGARAYRPKVLRKTLLFAQHAAGLTSASAPITNDCKPIGIEATG